jgi:hypothetical protein
MCIGHQSAKRTGGLQRKERAVLTVDLGYPSQRGERVDVQEAVLRQGIEARLGCGPETGKPIREQHNELLALAANPLIPSHWDSSEDFRQGEQRFSAGTVGRQPGDGPLCLLGALPIRVAPLPRW